MSLFIESKKKTEVVVLKKPLFSVCDQQVVIKFKEGEEVFNLYEITNVRFKKERNLSINIILLLFTVLLYFITSTYSDYLDRNFIYYFLSYAITIISSIVSLSIENYTYRLYVHTRNLGLKKLRLSKKDESNAMYFVSLLKSDYLKKCS